MIWADSGSNNHVSIDVSRFIVINSEVFPVVMATDFKHHLVFVFEDEIEIPGVIRVLPQVLGRFGSVMLDSGARVDVVRDDELTAGFQAVGKRCLKPCELIFGLWTNFRLVGVNVILKGIHRQN
jgi:hypothetical protein